MSKSADHVFKTMNIPIGTGTLSVEEAQVLKDKICELTDFIEECLTTEGVWIGRMKESGHLLDIEKQNTALLLATLEKAQRQIHKERKRSDVLFMAAKDLEDMLYAEKQKKDGCLSRRACRYCIHCQEIAEIEKRWAIEMEERKRTAPWHVSPQSSYIDPPCGMPKSQNATPAGNNLHRRVPQYEYFQSLKPTRVTEDYLNIKPRTLSSQHIGSSANSKAVRCSILTPENGLVENRIDRDILMSHNMNNDQEQNGRIHSQNVEYASDDSWDISILSRDTSNEYIRPDCVPRLDLRDITSPDSTERDRTVMRQVVDVADIGLKVINSPSNESGVRTTIGIENKTSNAGGWLNVSLRDDESVSSTQKRDREANNENYNGTTKDESPMYGTANSSRCQFSKSCSESEYHRDADGHDSDDEVESFENAYVALSESIEIVKGSCRTSSSHSSLSPQQYIADNWECRNDDRTTDDVSDIVEENIERSTNTAGSIGACVSNLSCAESSSNDREEPKYSFNDFEETGIESDMSESIELVAEDNRNNSYSTDNPVSTEPKVSFAKRQSDRAESDLTLDDISDIGDDFDSSFDATDEHTAIQESLEKLTPHMRKILACIDSSRKTIGIQPYAWGNIKKQKTETTVVQTRSNTRIVKRIYN